MLHVGFRLGGKGEQKWKRGGEGIFKVSIADAILSLRPPHLDLVQDFHSDILQSS